MLTNAAVKAAQPGARPYKLFDAGGLHLLIRPSGSKTFRMKFKRRSKEQLLTFGQWPELSLTDARARRDEIRDQLRRGVDIKVNSLRVRIGNDQIHTFEQLARAWHERRQVRWSTDHAADVIASLERDVFPAIGAADPRAVTAQDVLSILTHVESRGRIETARRLRERISGVFRFGIPLQICNSDPAALVSDELSPRPVQRPQPALTDLTELVKLLHLVNSLQAPIVHKLASRFLALTAVRLGTLRGARWDEIEGVDFGGQHQVEQGSTPLWRIPPARMKLTKVRKSDPLAEHLVPLSRQAVAVLQELHKLTGTGELLFPGRRVVKPIGEGTIGELYDAAGYAGRHVPHGWRASFSTILNELYPPKQFPAHRALIDQALAHVASKGKVEAAYNRSQWLEAVGELFQEWADLIAPDRAIPSVNRKVGTEIAALSSESQPAQPALATAEQSAAL
jgi:integrase